jgi:hypothetical protein
VPCFWADVEFLAWWVKRGPLAVPVVTTGNLADPHPGALGQPGTTVLSPSSLDYGTLPGGRLTLGGWFDPEGTFGADVSVFALGQESKHFGVFSNSAGTPALFVPLFLPDKGRETGFPLAVPGTFAGGFAAASNTRLWGAEVNGLMSLLRDRTNSLALLAGFRYLDLRENLNFYATSEFLPLQEHLTLQDSFATHNQFYGAQVGLRGHYDFAPFFVQGEVKVALGPVCESVSINGASVMTAPGAAPVTTAGGIFAQPTNSGKRSRTDFAVVPQIGFQVGTQVSSHVRVFVGYDFLYWSEVARPGEQIDRNVNSTQLLGGKLAGTAAPEPLFKSTDFWAQGITFGLELTF